jgi:hypothetical protein
MDDEEDNRAELLSEYLDRVKMPSYDRRKASEIFYTLSERGMFHDCSFVPEDAEIFFKAFVLSQILSDDEVKSIRM